MDLNGYCGDMELHRRTRLQSEFQENGFAVVRDFLVADEVDEINREVSRYVSEVVPSLPPGLAFYEVKGDPSTLKQLPRISEHDEYFGRLFLHQRMSELAEALLGCSVKPRDMQWFNKPPGVGEPTPAHQDGFYDKIEPIKMVNLWLALDPVDEENGCVRYVVGSNRRGLRPHARTNTLGFSQGLVDYGPEDEGRESPVCASAGDMLVHHGLTIHRADGNPSDRNRRAIGSVYYAAHIRENAEATANYSRQLTDDLIRKGKL
jgi:phytanoyl-CoA hydroxylase